MSASGEKPKIVNELNFEVLFRNKKVIVVACVTKGKQLNLLDADWIHLFNLWNEQISFICEFVRCSNRNIDSLKKKNIQAYKDLFTEEPSLCTKVDIFTGKRKCKTDF